MSGGGGAWSSARADVTCARASRAAAGSTAVSMPRPTVLLFPSRFASGTEPSVQRFEMDVHDKKYPDADRATHEF